MMTTHIRRDATILPALVLAATLPASLAQAQLSEQNATRVDMQVFNTDTNSWGTVASAVPGSRVEWRVVVSYTGTNTNVFALGSMTYQPTFSNIDNTGPDVDQLAPWRNGGLQGNAVANSMLTAAEGASGSALASYGRVVFGATAANATSQNVVTTHRHGGDFPINRAPVGSWLRVAGSFVTRWPLPTLPLNVDATATELNYINRGIQANQVAAISPITLLPNTFHVGGTQNLVVFRGALLLSTDLRSDNITLGIAAGTQQRLGAISSGDDTRFISWQTGITDNGSWRTGFTINSATIVIPAPASALGFALLALTTARRSRVHTRHTA
jgi:hypothetical protein